MTRSSDLSLGNPVMEPPPEFLEALRGIAASPTPGMHRYMPNAGYPETRAAVAAQLAEETGLAFTANEVLMACGAGGALNVVLKTLLDPGDEVVIFAPVLRRVQLLRGQSRGELPRRAAR